MQTRMVERPHTAPTTRPGCSTQRRHILVLPKQKLQHSQGWPLGQHGQSLLLLASAHSPGTKLSPPIQVLGPLAWQQHC